MFLAKKPSRGYINKIGHVANRRIPKNAHLAVKTPQ